MTSIICTITGNRIACQHAATLIGIVFSMALLPFSSMASPFTVVVLPDTQYYSESFPDQFLAQTQWIVHNRAAANIALVSHLGDIVENGGQGPVKNAVEWNHADAAMKILDDNIPDLPYGVVLGNHDYDRVNSQRAAKQYVRFFGASRYSQRNWYGGNSPDQLNHYQSFSAGGREYLHITLEWNPQPSSIRWAQRVLNANPSLPTIISTHDYLTADKSHSSPAGRKIFDSLVDNNSQVFMVLSGHVPEEGHQTTMNAAGHDVFEILADYQYRPNGGDGWMRLIEFDEANNRIGVRTYSPTLDEFEMDSNSQFHFSIDFEERFGVVPEPSSHGIISVGLIAIFCYGRQRRRTP